MKVYNVIKTTLFFSLMFLSVSMFWCVPQIDADHEPYMQWGLPKGAKVRLGKGTIGNIAYSPDGTRLAVASSIGVWLYDAQTGEELDLLRGHTGSVGSVSFSPDGNTLASGSSDETIRLWNAQTGENLHTLTGYKGSVNSVLFSPNGQTLASGSGDGTVLLWEVTPSPPSVRMSMKTVQSTSRI